MSWLVVSDRGSYPDSDHRKERLPSGHRITAPAKV